MLDFRGGGGGGGTPGVAIASNDASRLALAPTDGTALYQTDTKEFWFWTGGNSPTGQWSLFGRVNNLIFAEDTASIDFTLAASASQARATEPVTLTASVKLSAVAASAGNTKINLDIQSDGVRAMVANSAIRGLLSATGPVAYDNTTGVISMPVATDSVNGYLSSADHTALTNVIAGLATEITNRTNGDTTNATNLTNHINSTTAHSANHITVTPTGNISSTDVQAALVEIQGDVDTLNTANHGDVTLGAFGSAPDAKGATLATQVLTMQPADATHPGMVSIAAQVMGGEKRLQDGAKVGASTSLGASVVFSVESTTKGAIPEPVMTTAQRTAIASPATGLKVYDSDLKQSVYYNGTNWEPERGFAVPAAVTIADGGTLTPGDYRRQVLTIGGTSTTSTIATLATTNAKSGDELLVLGNSDANPVVFSSTTNATTNGTCTLGSNDSIRFVFVGSAWIEVSRSA